MSISEHILRQPLTILPPSMDSHENTIFLEEVWAFLLPEKREYKATRSIRSLTNLVCTGRGELISVSLVHHSSGPVLRSLSCRLFMGLQLTLKTAVRHFEWDRESDQQADAEGHNSLD